MLQGSVVWAPFGASFWPAKLLTINTDHAKSGRAMVQLFGSGVKTQVSASGMAAYSDGYDDKCKMIHSALGQQVGDQNRQFSS